MDFNWIGLVFWVLVGDALFLFGWGLAKRSPKILILSGFSLLLPALYFIGAENWLRLIGLLPAIPFVIAFLIRKEPTPSRLERKGRKEEF